MGKQVKRSQKRFGLGVLSLFAIWHLTVLGPLTIQAAEEPYPNRPINLVVSMSPGGVLDSHARIIGDRLAEVLGQPIIKLHKPAGGGTLAASFVLKAKADGYTLFTGTSSNMIIPPILKKVDYTWEDFVPLGIYYKGIVHVIVKTDGPFKTLEDFVQAGKKQTLKVSSYGKNSHAEFVLESFSRLAGIRLAHVPYKSCGEAVTALLGGHVDASFCTSAMGQVAAGTVKLLAIADEERSRYLPDVRTLKECGYPVALPLLGSFCVVKKTPGRIVEILANATEEVVKRYSKEIQEELVRLDNVPTFYNSKQSLQLFRQDYETTLHIVKEMAVHNPNP